jgi:transposase-like protein
MQPASPVQSPHSLALCPYCPAPTKVGVHSRKLGRYRYHRCRKTFTQSYGTPLYGLKTDLNDVTLVVTLLVFGCPLPAVVMPFKLDERTLADWLDKAGEHAMRVQDQLVCQGQLDLGQVQADELWCRSQRRVLWLATAISVASRLLI